MPTKRQIAIAKQVTNRLTGNVRFPIGTMIKEQGRWGIVHAYVPETGFYKVEIDGELTSLPHGTIALFRKSKTYYKKYLKSLKRKSRSKLTAMLTPKQK